MMRNSMTVLVAALLSSMAASAADLTAAQIAERNVAARGGLEAWRQVSTMVWSGDMEVGGKQNTKLPFVLSMKRPNKSRVEITFQNQTAVQTWDGSQGWKLRPYLNRTEADPFTTVEAKAEAGVDELDGPLVDYARKGTSIELLGTEPVAGKNAYKLRLKKSNGDQRLVWIDATTFLEAKIEGDPRKMDNKVRKVYVGYADYRAEGGLMVPHMLETSVDGVKGSHKMFIRTVSVNRPLDDAAFTKPRLVAQTEKR